MRVSNEHGHRGTHPRPPMDARPNSLVKCSTYPLKGVAESESRSGSVWYSTASMLRCSARTVRCRQVGITITNVRRMSTPTCPFKNSVCAINMLATKAAKTHSTWRGTPSTTRARRSLMEATWISGWVQTIVNIWPNIDRNERRRDPQGGHVRFSWSLLRYLTCLCVVPSLLRLRARRARALKCS